MKELTRKTANVNQQYPERILQFGGGNFLRGFVDWIIDKYNRQSNDDKLGILAVKVRKGGSYQKWKDQDGLFHLFSKGFSQGKTINDKILITSVVRVLEAFQDWKEFLESSHQPALNIVISNTTETGLKFSDADGKDDIPSTFPGQLCKWLHQRFLFFKGDKKSGCSIIPCELLNENGQILKDSLLAYADHWGLEDDFKNWLGTHCYFCNTLVDRIVPGINSEHIEEYQERIGFADQMMTEGEPYHLWAIETKHDLGAKLPLNRIGLNVIYTDDLSPYRERKLKILNGAHTSMVPIGLLLGVDMVKDAINHATIAPFIEKLIFEEIVPSLEVDLESSTAFAEEVLDRFRNPFLEHYLKSISLYSISKFNARLKPTVKAYVNNNKTVPSRILLSFASFLIYYSGGFEDQIFTPDDEKDKIDTLQSHWSKLKGKGGISSATLAPLLADESLWDEDLNEIPGFADAVSVNLVQILEGKLAEMVKTGGSKKRD